MRHSKEKDIPFKKEEIKRLKLFTFIVNMVTYAGNSRKYIYGFRLEYTRIYFLQLISEFSKVTGYKISTHKINCIFIH